MTWCLMLSACVWKGMDKDRVGTYTEKKGGGWEWAASKYSRAGPESRLYPLFNYPAQRM